MFEGSCVLQKHALKNPCEKKGKTHKKNQEQRKTRATVHNERKKKQGLEGQRK